MNDLNFAELDKAINALYNSLDDNKQKEPGNSGSVATKSERVVVNRATAKKPVNNSTTSGKGHFMDMVHPSSDANVQRKHNFAAQRQAEIIQAEDAIATTDKPVEIKVEAEPKPKPMPEPVPEVTPAVELKPTVEPVAKKPSTSSIGRRSNQFSASRHRHSLAQPMPTLSTAPVPSKAETTPYVSPFLPDAKVEKRPLGQPVHRPEATIDEVIRQTVEPVKKAYLDDVKVSDNELDNDIEEIITASVAPKKSKKKASKKQAKAEAKSAKRANKRQRKAEAELVATRPSVADRKDMSLNNGRRKAAQIFGGVLMFIAIIALGGLIGFALYYFGF